MLQDAISRRLLRSFLYALSYIYMEIYLHEIEIHVHIKLLLRGTLICFLSNAEEFIYGGMFFVAKYERSTGT